MVNQGPWESVMLRAAGPVAHFKMCLCIFKRHTRQTVDAMFSFSVSLSPLFSGRPVFCDTHNTCTRTQIHVHTHKHRLLPLGPLIVPTGTRWRPITTTGDEKKTSFIQLSRCLSLHLCDLSVGLFPFISPFSRPSTCLWHFSPSFYHCLILSFSLTPVVILAPRRRA